MAGCKILVVDDDEAVRRVLRAMLESGGFEVLEAPNGNEASILQSATPADLLITDLIMPEREGLETITAFRRDFPGVRIIAISGAFGGAFLNAARLLGADAILPKPVSASKLLEVAGKLLEETAQQRRRI